MEKTKTSLLFSALLVVAPVLVQAARTQYISDDISLSLREGPSNDAGSLGIVHSGDAVTVLESRGSDSYARVRTADGREGWIAARYLSDRPAARDPLKQLQQQLDQAHQQLQATQRDLDTAKQQLARAQPALQLAADNDQLRTQLARREQADAQLEARYNAELARRRTLLVGAGLVGAGVLLGLVLPRLGRRRRRGDF